MRPSQLAKQHGHELAPTGETPRVPLGLVLLDRLLELPAREQLQHLRKNAAYFHYVESPEVELVFVWNPIQRIRGSASHRQRLPPLRPAVTPLIWTAMIPNSVLQPDATRWRSLRQASELIPKGSVQKAVR